MSFDAQVQVRSGYQVPCGSVRHAVLGSYSRSRDAIRVVLSGLVCECEETGLLDCSDHHYHADGVKWSMGARSWQGGNGDVSRRFRPDIR
jgi:hypothetical protein